MESQLAAVSPDDSQPLRALARLVKENRRVNVSTLRYDSAAPTNLLEGLIALKEALINGNHQREAEALQDVYNHCTSPVDFGGLALSPDSQLSEKDQTEILFLVSAYLESLNSVDRHRRLLEPLQERPKGRRGMTLAEKIFAAHDVERKGEVKPGDVIRVDVDWVIASELSWSGMAKTYNQLGDPGIWRNDRVWLAGDHVVDPRVKDHPRIKPLVEASERARQVFKLSEYQGMNYTIMHTEFCRERAQPGMLVIGSDSHTCSAGSVSSLAIGLGVADVTMPLITGETWFQVPETVEIRFINEPAPGLGGKDVILYVLKELKRNTVAADRVVEYTGPGLKHLSCDARFAIANMTTEFGGVSGIFVPDEITQAFINKRKNPKYKKFSTYYKPDDDVQYVETHIIDLAQVESFVARYPSPDDVVPVSEVAGTKLDGCFIGACTTAREDLILAALVLEVGLKRGWKPVKHGTRKVVPGSRPILRNLRELGLADVYEQAGFEVGVPGCSYCVGMSADKAGKGEVWLSSQNRNFENRMGPGAIGSISSAVTVAASSFEMSITDPKPLLDEVDGNRLRDLLGSPRPFTATEIHYVEPGFSPDASKETTTTTPSTVDKDPSTAASQPLPESTSASLPTHAPSEDTMFTSPQHDQPLPLTSPTVATQSSPMIITSKIQTLGDFIDTDALAPNEAISNPHITTRELGSYCLKYTHPDFHTKIAAGMTVVVAGRAFGVGSSRENAVTALQGAGVSCVIARSFAFIYRRNQANLGFLGVIVDDDDFYALAQDRVEITVDVSQRKVRVRDQEFRFELSRIEERLVGMGGMTSAFRRWGKGVFEGLTGGGGGGSRSGMVKNGNGLLEDDKRKEELRW